MLLVQNIMQKIFISILILVCFLSHGFSHLQTKEEDDSALIKTEKINNELIIKAEFKNISNEKKNIGYKLQVEKTSKSGNSNINQSGKAEVKKGETKLLSTSKVNLEPGLKCNIELLIYENGKKIAEKSLFYKI